jgi:cyclopropane fatty-acyl-phospholipid synthase-like methyltransferase|tara:strand:+ start:3964 stop:4977 length:1014 start_codon:yes stop_codon:yes gene_type:complete
MSSPGEAQQRVDTTRLQGIARGYTESAVLYTALDISLFSHVHNGANSEADLVELTRLRPLDVDRLVTCCLSMGLLSWDADKLVNAPDVDAFLVEGSTKFAGPWMTFTREDVSDWFDMTAKMRSPSASLLGMYEDLTVESAKKYHEATASIGFGAARRFVKSVDLNGRRHLLDLGGGSGAYSITAVKKFEGLRATVLDLPPVVIATQEYIKEENVEDRVTTKGADFTKGDFPSPVDVVVMASNLPIYGSDVIADVVKRAFRALEPGGEMHLIGEMLDDDKCGPLDAAMWGMNELICGSLGRAHTRSDCVEYFEKAGFVDIEISDFVPNVLVRCSGWRP